MKPLSDYAEPAVLRDGQSLLIRAVSPDDKPRLRDLFHRLSPESVRRRAFAARTEVTDAELCYLTELDFVDHVALVTVVRHDGEESIVGVGRWIRKAGSPCAEVAFTVADAFQGRGVGTLLLEHLSRIARTAGVDELRADVLAENIEMLKVFADSGFVVERTLEGNVYRVTSSTCPTEAFLGACGARELHATAESVRVFFEPRSVAVIGASRREGSIGRAILCNIVEHGFRGKVYPVNPNANELLGRPCLPSVEVIGAPVDLAVIVVPAPRVRDALSDCARAGVRGVVVISSGFAEVAGRGRAVQDEMRSFVRASGMRMIGPNCMGVLSARPDVSLDATFAPIWPSAGNVSMVTQSGALGIAMLDRAGQLDLGLAGFASVGNKADVSGNDLLSYWASDPRTSVIALYLESFGNPRRFARIAPIVARNKPIVAVKAGRSTAGARAASSHSAALASVDVGADALFAQAGVIRTNTLEELFDVVSFLSTQPLPAGPRIGVVTNAGGPGILLADACEAHGLRLPELAPETLGTLRTFLPSEAGLSNPIDMIASATPEYYERTIAAVGADPNVDALVVIYIPPLVTKPEEIAKAIATAAGKVPPQKPVAVVFMSSHGAPACLSAGPRGKLPTYTFPENAANAVAAAQRYARWRERPRGTLARLPREREHEIRQTIERAREPWLEPSAVAELLALADIPFAELASVAPEPEAAVTAASALGYPVVLKAVAPGLLHKSEVGGVVVGLSTPADVRRAAAEMVERLAKAGHPLTGLVVQREIEGGVEAIVGVTTDPSFGPLLVAGLGGVQVEVLRDVAVRLTPVSDLDATEMLQGLRASRLLEGFRGAPVADRAALISVIEKVSAVVEAIPEIEELELNPLKVRARGQGAVAVDARIRVTRRTAAC